MPKEVEPPSSGTITPILATFRSSPPLSSASLPHAARTTTATITRVRVRQDRLFVTTMGVSSAGSKACRLAVTSCRVAETPDLDGDSTPCGGACGTSSGSSSPSAGAPTRPSWPGWPTTRSAPTGASAVTAVSASLAGEEAADCAALAEEWGLRWRTVETDELARPAYVANDTDRCRHCKSELMDALAPLAAAESATIVLGTNLDDLDDHRPGPGRGRRAGGGVPPRRRRLHQGRGAGGVPHASACAPGTSRPPPASPPGSPTARPSPSAPSTGWDGPRPPSTAWASARSASATTATWPAWRSSSPTWPWPSSGRAEVVAAVKAAGYSRVTLDLEGFRSGNLNLPDLDD